MSKAAATLGMGVQFLAKVRQPRVRRVGAFAAFVLPTFTVYTLFLIVPLIGTVALSFVSWDGASWSDLNFVGIANYRELAHDPIFWLSLRHNAIFLVGAIILKTGVALMLALALEQRLRFSWFFRATFLMPAVLSLVVIGIVFNLVLSPTFGILNPLVKTIGLPNLSGEWLGNPGRALPMVMVIDAWHDFGIYMFLFIIRIMSIPEELHEAAFVDGASRIRNIWHVTLPLLRPTMGVVILLASIESLKLFDLIYVMTRGGPGNATEVLSHYAYLQNFEGNRVGYGSAILVVLLAISLLLAYVVVTRLRSSDDS